MAIAIVLTWLVVSGMLLNHPALLGAAPRDHVIVMDPLDATRRFRGGELLEVSSDGGNTWREVPMLVPATDVVDIAFAPDAPRTVWVAMRELGLVRSLDGGVVWEPVDLGFVPLMRGIELTRVALGPAGHVVVSTRAGDVESQDGGASWRPAPSLPLGTESPYALVHQLHTGYLAAPALVLVHDAAGAGAVLLAITGLVIWWRPVRARLRRGRARDDAPDRPRARG